MSRSPGVARSPKAVSIHDFRFSCIRGSKTASVRRFHHMFILLIINYHDMTLGWDETMERNDSSDSFEHGLSHCPIPLRIPLGAIRRKLWILNAKLRSLPAKIELIHHQSGGWVNVDDLERSMHDGVGLAKKRIDGRKVLGCWPARWNRARLVARADRAERRAAVAMNKASVSLSNAFEAVLQAACARMRADEAYRNLGETPTPRRPG